MMRRKYSGFLAHGWLAARGLLLGLGLGLPVIGFPAIGLPAFLVGGHRSTELLCVGGQRLGMAPMRRSRETEGSHPRLPSCELPSAHPAMLFGLRNQQPHQERQS